MLHLPELGKSKFVPLLTTLVLLLSVVTGVALVQRQQELRTKAAGNTYFVATNGSDSNSGTLAKPFRTIQRGVNAASAGDTVLVRGGNYYEVVKLSKSGQPGNPITLRASPGEYPVIDGRAGVGGTNKGLPRCASGCSGSQLARVDPISGKGFVWEGLVDLTGNHLVFDGFEVARSMGRGIRVYDKSGTPQDITIRNCQVHHSRNAAINIQDSRDATVEHCKVWANADFATYSRSASVLNWPVIVQVPGSENIVFRNNEIFNNWGEGVSATKGSKNVIIEDNVIYDNYALQLYINNAQEVIVRRNLIYHSGDPTYFRGSGPSSCLPINNELKSSQSEPPTSDVTVINNFIKGCSSLIALWSQSNVGHTNMLIAHNTLVDAQAGNGTAAAIRIKAPTIQPHRNVRFKNNIIVQQTDSNYEMVSGSAEGVTFLNNLWWPDRPPASASGAGDVYADPRLTRSGPTGPGQLSPTYFNVSEGSAAIGVARVDVDKVATDFYTSSRDSNPDIGAHEFGATDGSSPTPTPTLTKSPTPIPPPTATPTPTPTPPPLPGDINVDGIVNILDFQLLNNLFGTNNPDADLNNDGIVNILDFQILSNNFGKK